jgi:putative ABC transport system ATP-binding protein
VRNERIGFIFQAFNLIGDLTVLQNVELPLTYRQAMRLTSAARPRCTRSSASACRIA